MNRKKEYIKPETDMARYIAQGTLLVTSWGTENRDNPFQQQGGVKNQDDESIDDWGGNW